MMLPLFEVKVIFLNFNFEKTIFFCLLREFYLLYAHHCLSTRSGCRLDRGQQWTIVTPRMRMMC